MKKLFLLGFVLFSFTLMAQVGQDNSNTNAGEGPNFGTALGSGNDVPGQYAFIGGSNSQASGSHSFGFGQSVRSSGLGSFALGSSVFATAENSWIIGKGTSDFGSTFENNISNSFMIGFNTSVPSFFVQGFTREEPGYVGIFTTDPTSELDVNGTITTTGFKMTTNPTAGFVLTSDAEGNASWQPNDGAGSGSGGDSYWKANGQHIYFISASGPLGNGNVGIGPASSNPLEKLHVFGNLRINGFMRGGETSGALKVQTDYGYTILGAKANNASYFETDRNKFIFNKDVQLFENLNFDFNNTDAKITYGASNLARTFKLESLYDNGAGKGSVRGIVIDENGNLGVGTDSPTAELDVDGRTKTEELQVTSDGSTSGFVLADSDGSGNAEWVELGSIDGDWQSDGNGNIYRKNGNVGIGTNQPVAPLHIKPFSDGPGFQFSSQTSDMTYPADFQFSAIGGDNMSTLQIYNSNHGTNYSWACDSDGYGTIEGMRLSIRPWPVDENGHTSFPNTKLYLNGRMGINTEVLPGQELSVNGVIGCKKVVVTLDADWPDYVFDEDYQLPQLSEIESFVKKNKHLPGVPSAKEIKENGQDLGEMNTILLQKIEELTLLMIEQQKEIDALKKQVNQ